VAAAAVELMGSMRHYDRARVFAPCAVDTIVHRKAAAHCEGDLDRVVRVLAREAGIAADPEAAAAPQEDTTDTDDRPRLRWRAHGVTCSEHKSAVSFKPAMRSLRTICSTNQPGSHPNHRRLP
ncbi:MAG TPA: hypothetical protein VGH48_11250, partial [Caldimonas sp.]